MRDVLVGVDMAKADFVVGCCPRILGGPATNESDGITATVARLRTLTPALIVTDRQRLRAGASGGACDRGPAAGCRESAAGA